MVIDAFLACLFNVHCLIFLSMVHEYAYFYEYIWKLVHYCCLMTSAIWGCIFIETLRNWRCTWVVVRLWVQVAFFVVCR